MYRKPLSELNLIDNFLFTMLIDHEIYGPTVAKTILSTILQRKIRIRKIHAEKVILGGNTDLHGIRLDAMIEGEATEVSPGDVFDLEPERKQKEKTVLPRRARYYHSRMDGKFLETGRSYRGLPDTWVIFFTSFDPFDKDRMVYTIRNGCVEEPGISYDDGATTLYLYVHGARGNPHRELQELLKYMGTTTAECAVTPALKQIHIIVEDVKKDPSVREAYMDLREYIDGERMEAAEEAAAAAALKISEAEARADLERNRADKAESRAEAAEAQLDLYKQLLKEHHITIPDTSRKP